MIQPQAAHGTARQCASRWYVGRLVLATAFAGGLSCNSPGSTTVLAQAAPRDAPAQADTAARPDAPGSAAPPASSASPLGNRVRAFGPPAPANPAHEDSRTIGPLVLTARANPSRGDATVTAALDGTTIAMQRLTLAQPSLSLDVKAGTSAATGSVTLDLQAAPLISSVEADVQATGDGTTTPYRGTVVTWTAEADPVLAEFTQVLNGDLSAHTTVRGAAGNVVQFQFVSGSTPLATLTATQFSPQQAFPTKIQGGDVTVDAGAKITLTIPTTLQPGMLFLQATIATATTPSTPVAASMAEWTLPAPPAD